MKRLGLPLPADSILNSSSNDTTTAASNTSNTSNIPANLPPFPWDDPNYKEKSP